MKMCAISVSQSSPSSILTHKSAHSKDTMSRRLNVKWVSYSKGTPSQPHVAPFACQASCLVLCAFSTAVFFLLHHVYSQIDESNWCQTNICAGVNWFSQLTTLWGARKSHKPFARTANYAKATRVALPSNSSSPYGTHAKSNSSGRLIFYAAGCCWQLFIDFSNCVNFPLPTGVCTGWTEHIRVSVRLSKYLHACADLYLALKMSVFVKMRW